MQFLKDKEFWRVYLVHVGLAGVLLLAGLAAVPFITSLL